MLWARNVPDRKNFNFEVEVNKNVEYPGLLNIHLIDIFLLQTCVRCAAGKSFSITVNILMTADLV